MTRHELLPIRIGTPGNNEVGLVKWNGRQRVQLIWGSPVQIHGLLVALVFTPLGPIALRLRWMAAVKAEATSPEKDREILGYSDAAHQLPWSRIRSPPTLPM